MPPASRAVAKRSKQRLALYLTKLMNGKRESKNRIGSVVSVNATRVKAWASGQRYMSPDTAFAFGEALRTDLHWETSGIEFLWACGHWPEILEILKYMSAGDISDPNDLATGPESAAMLYSWLPGTMFEFEKENVQIRFREAYEIADPMFWSRIIPPSRYSAGEPDALAARVQEIVESSETGGREVFRYSNDQSRGRDPEGHYLVDAEKALSELTQRCRTEGFYERIADAWERYNQGALAGPESILASPPGTSAKMAEIELHMLDAIIHGARKLNEAIFPSYAIPRIWRMIAGWIDNVVPGHEVYSAALPDTFVSASEVQSRSWVDFIYHEYEYESQATPEKNDPE